MTQDTFEALEQAGWTEKAAAYDDLFATISSQAIEPTLESFGSLANRRVLDVACGPGRIAGSARRRGARSEGGDHAPTMLAKARSRYADATFTQGNAERLPHRDSRFDAVICGFRMLRFAQPADILEYNN